MHHSAWKGCRAASPARRLQQAGTSLPERPLLIPQGLTAMLSWTPTENRLHWAVDCTVEAEASWELCPQALKKQGSSGDFSNQQWFTR